MIANNLRARINTSLILLTIIILIFLFNQILLFSLIVFGCLSLIEFFDISKKIVKNKFYLLFFNCTFIFYIFSFCFLFFFFSNFEQLKIILFIFLLGCISSDLGGYIFGKFFKGPRLTKISPNKTVSGAIGSILLSIGTISFFFFLITKDISLSIIILSIVNSISCQIGDLFFSFLKRKAKLKNTGTLLPGHGGVLDRLDGIFLGIPLSFIALALLS
ncbi:phosphatidate cytidylyltransferase [Pelagibacteraceae bacterium]|nr:phosphatidate cytidylyltransferase [Pelagibacteraceae bacterium]